jgi:hypothetical protein
MRTDTYTKIMLTIIAFMLTLIACKTVVSPEKNVNAEGPFAGVQFSNWYGQPEFFDTRTGEIWAYVKDGEQWYLAAKYKIAKPGEPMVVEFDRYAKKPK